MTRATTETDLKDITLSERSQIEILRLGNLTGTEETAAVADAMGRSDCLMGTEFTGRQWKHSGNGSSNKCYNIYALPQLKID